MIRRGLAQRASAITTRYASPRKTGADNGPGAAPPPGSPLRSGGRGHGRGPRRDPSPNGCGSSPRAAGRWVQGVEARQRILERWRRSAFPGSAALSIGKNVDPFAVEEDPASRDPERVEQAMMVRPATFPPPLPDHPQDLSGCDDEGNAIHRRQRPSPGRQLHRQAFDGKDRRLHQRSLGLKASRIQSPSRFTARTRTASTAPGKTVTPTSRRRRGNHCRSGSWSPANRPASAESLLRGRRGSPRERLQAPG